MNLVEQAVNRTLKIDAHLTFSTSSLPKIRWSMADESDDKRVKTEDSFKDKEEFDSPLKEYKPRKRIEISQKFLQFYCKLCNVQSSSKVDLNIHRAGKKHKRKLEMSQKLSLFDCDLCNFKSTCQMSLDIHKAGKTHQKKLEMPQTLSEFYCNLCNINSTCQMSLDIHKAGKTHLRNLQYGFALS